MKRSGHAEPSNSMRRPLPPIVKTGYVQVVPDEFGTRMHFILRHQVRRSSGIQMLSRRQWETRHVVAGNGSATLVNPEAARGLTGVSLSVTYHTRHPAEVQGPLN